MCRMFSLLLFDNDTSTTSTRIVNVELTNHTISNIARGVRTLKAIGRSTPSQYVSQLSIFQKERCTRSFPAGNERIKSGVSQSQWSDGSKFAFESGIHLQLASKARMYPFLAIPITSDMKHKINEKGN